MTRDDVIRDPLIMRVNGECISIECPECGSEQFWSTEGPVTLRETCKMVLPGVGHPYGAPLFSLWETNFA